MNIEAKLRALFIPNPTDELGPSDESQYRDGYNTALEDAIAAIDAAGASEGDAKKAARYDWLQKQRSDVWHEFADVPMNRTDELIDAAIAKENGDE